MLQFQKNNMFSTLWTILINLIRLSMGSESDKKIIADFADHVHMK